MVWLMGRKWGHFYGWWKCSISSPGWWLHGHTDLFITHWALHLKCMHLVAYILSFQILFKNQSVKKKTSILLQAVFSKFEFEVILTEPWGQLTFFGSHIPVHFTHKGPDWRWESEAGSSWTEFHGTLHIGIMHKQPGCLEQITFCWSTVKIQQTQKPSKFLISFLEPKIGFRIYLLTNILSRVF